MQSEGQMVTYPGRALLRACVPVALVASGLSACGVADHHPTAAAPSRTTPRAASAEPAAPSVPTLTRIPRQGAAGQTLPARDVRLAQEVSYDDVAPAALDAYQRAAQVIDAADPGCRLSWTLLAALGKANARYGRYGPLLDGRHGTVTVPDSDGGLVDGNAQYDRAVGPMQLLPSTWAQVAVDADGDGKRDPQDLDDASLGAAVFLCAGDDDLGTRQGKKAAVHRYNHSRPYVLYVLALSHQYTLSERALSPVLAARTVSLTATEADVEPAVATGVQAVATPTVVVEPPHHHAATATSSPDVPAATGSVPTASADPSPSGSPSPSCGAPTPSPTDSPTPSTGPSATPTAEPTCATSTPEPSSSPDPSPNPSSTSSSAPSPTPSAVPSTEPTAAATP